MKNISKEFNTVAENPFGAKYILKIVNLTDNTEIKDDINDFVYSAMINDDDVFTIGNTCSATISFSIINPTVNLNNKEIEVYQGLDINGIVEYIKLGIFKVLKPKKDRNITRYQCVDRMTYLMNMPYSSNLTFPTTDLKILEEICSQTGISLMIKGSKSHSISNKPSGYTRREIIAYMSQLQGKNAKINSDGNLEIIWYTDANYVIDDNKIYYDGTSDINSEIDYKIEYIECTVRSLDGSEENVIKAGSGVNGIKIENPFMTQTILYELANKLVGFTFRGAEFEFLGDFRLEVGDIVSVETNGEVYRVPIMQIEHKSDGGVVTTITSIGETDTENEIDLSSPNIHAMDRYYADLVLINKAMINKLSVDEADIRYLQVEQLDAIEANIENAVIENLEGKFITVEELDAEKARITVLEANSLTSNSAIIKDLQAGVTKTNTLIFGSASGDTIQTSFSNSVIAQLGDAQIKSAMIKEVSALKITGLDLNTTKFTVHSEDGLSQWKDNTITIHDGVLGTPRIQIGKDGSGDYNMYIWNNQGKLMFDALGVTENGITRKIIRDDMVSDEAEINAGKINLESLFGVINDDTSYTLKSSKIFIDEEGQTLDVSFKVMSSNVSDLQETQISQGTNIETIQGQISTKIWQQDITKAIDDIEVGGRNLLLNSNFTKSSEYWGVSSGASLEIIADSIYGNVAKVISSSNSTGLFRNALGRPNIQDGLQCVFSFYAKADTEMTIYCALNGYGLGNSKQFTVGTEWVRIVGYFTKTSNNYVPRIYGNGTYYIANVQLELGNVVTDWNIASEDIEKDVTNLTTKYSLIEQDLNGFKTTVSETYTTIEEFDALQIGGTNLFITNTASNGYINASGTIAKNDKFYASDYIEIEKGQEYTFSRVEDTTTGSIYDAWRIAWYDEEKTLIERVAYTDLVKTLTFPDTAKYIRVSAGKLSKIKVEKGNRATDWSPAPQDVDIKIDATTTIATQTADKFNWMVASGTSSTDFTLTDRMAELTAEIISLNGNVLVSGDMLLDGAITADKLATDAIMSRNYTEAVGTLNPLSGSKLNLSDGSFKSVNLKWDSTGYFTGKRGKIGDWHVSSKLYSSLSAYIPPTKKDLDKIKKYLLGQVTLTNDELEYYDLNNDGLVDALDMTNVKRILIGVTRYEDYDGKMRSPLNIDINALDGSKTIKFTATNPLGEEIESYLGATQCYFPAINGGYIYGDILEGAEANISGPLIVNDKVEMHGNGLELYYTTPYIDFHYNNDTTDRTARIVENSKGALTVYNTISNASDRRLKQDIHGLDGRYLNVLNLLKPVSYRFIKGSDNLNLGFVAQDVEKALIDSKITDLPLISQNSDGIYALDYNQITTLNTLGHLDHEERIQQLENDLAVANALIQSLLIQQSSV